MTIDDFIKTFGNSNLARDLFFYFSFLKHHKFKRFTRRQLYNLTGIRPHRQIEIEKLLKVHRIFPTYTNSSTAPCIQPSPQEVAIVKPQIPMATSPFNMPTPTITQRIAANGGVYEEVMFANPPTISNQMSDKEYVDDNFVIQKQDENSYVAYSKLYPDISVMLTSFQVEIAKQNPILLERAFQAKLNNSKHDRIVMQSNPFQKYLEKLHDKIVTEPTENNSLIANNLDNTEQPKTSNELMQLKERKKESNKERKKEKEYDLVKENIYIPPSNINISLPGTTVSNVPSTCLALKEEKERKKEINKERKKEKEESFELKVPIQQLPPEQQIQFVVQEWNKLAEEIGLAKVCKINERRKTSILKRLKEKEFDLPTILAKIKESDFLSGRKTEWRCDFDFVFLSAHNYIKILEGKYDNRRTPFTGRYKNFPDKVRDIFDFTQRFFGQQTASGEQNKNNNE